MSDIKFNCPKCEQHIQCDGSCSGMEIDCPNCATRMTVPSVEVAVAEEAAVAGSHVCPPPFLRS